MKINLIIIFSKINLILFSFSKASKVALIATVKMENIYLREFIEHYKTLEVDKIILIDNNNEEGERFEDVIFDYIQSNFVIVENYRNCKICQYKSYQECYYKYKRKFDWLMFFDVDEYLMLPNYKNVHEFLNDEIFKDFNIIHVHWIFYDDNNLIFYDNRPLQKRFTRPRHLISKNFTNNHIKSIIRTKFFKLLFTNSHTPKTRNKKYKVCDVTGTNVSNTYFSDENPAELLNLTVPYLKHFGLRTVEEYFKFKMKRGSATPYGNKNFGKVLSKDFFFNLNDWNVKKEFIADCYINEYYKYYNKTNDN